MQNNSKSKYKGTKNAKSKQIQFCSKQNAKLYNFELKAWFCKHVQGDTIRCYNFVIS